MSMLGRTDSSNKKSARKGTGNQKNVSAYQQTDVPSGHKQNIFDAGESAQYLRNAWKKSTVDPSAKKIAVEKTALPSFNFLEALRKAYEKYTLPSSQQEQAETTPTKEGDAKADEVVIDINDDAIDSEIPVNEETADSQSIKKSKKKKKKKKVKSKAVAGTLTWEGGALKFTPAAVQPIDNSESSSPSSSSSSVQEYERIPKECVTYLANRYEKQQSSSKSSTSKSLTPIPIKWINAEGVMKIIKETPDLIPKNLVMPMMTINTRGPRNVCAVLPHPSPYDSVKLCAKCNRVSYCSKDCQQLHWTRHKPDCRSDSLSESRKTSAEERFHSTTSIRRLLYPLWQSKFGKGVIVMMCRDFYPFDDDEVARNVYIIYVTMNDIKSESGPFSALLRPHHSELLKLSSTTETGHVTVVTVAVDQSGYITQFSEKIRATQVEMCKTLAGKDEDFLKTDMVSVPVNPLEVPVLCLFQ
eukprot:TRINITY_DN1833_c1_g1_i1.p1 TRINITY_DN1833_c1_g1~~TRINITY_DN1833_c1_g1_i1.p1  ORF type:complete len:470 (-),score=102.82 TRINITY_DN1833_c1_g1_i1:19-1428(-)